MTWFLVWGIWAVYFFVFEGIALFNHTSGDTFSEQVWAWLRGREHTTKLIYIKQDDAPGSYLAHIKGEPITTNGIPHNTWRTFVVGAFLVWLFFHLTFGWFH